MSRLNGQPEDIDGAAAPQGVTAQSADLEGRSSDDEEEARALPTPDLTNAGMWVWLHVYDVGSVASWMNFYVLRDHGLGAYHTGVEVLGIEWSFQTHEDCWDDAEMTGIAACEPKSHPGHVYLESICLGKTPLSVEEIRTLLSRSVHDWPANSYHITRRNCVDFADELAVSLRAPEPFPRWVHGIAKETAGSSVFGPVADHLWGRVKGHFIDQLRTRRQEQEAEDEALEIEHARFEICAPRGDRPNPVKGDGGLSDGDASEPDYENSPKKLRKKCQACDGVGIVGVNSLDLCRQCVGSGKEADQGKSDNGISALPAEAHPPPSQAQRSF